MGLAAETFNDGLRAYYLSFAAVAWFFSAWAFARHKQSSGLFKSGLRR